MQRNAYPNILIQGLVEQERPRQHATCVGVRRYIRCTSTRAYVCVYPQCRTPHAVRRGTCVAVWEASSLAVHKIVHVRSEAAV